MIILSKYFYYIYKYVENICKKFFSNKIKVINYIPNNITNMNYSNMKEK